MNNLKPINTLLSLSSILDLKEFREAKILLNTKYGNIYNFLPPHLTYTLLPLPEENLELAKEALTEYVKKQKKFKVHISDLIYEEEKKFFYVALSGDMIKKHHEDLINLLNVYRENYIREKDLKRLNTGHFDEQSIKYLKEYGYSRVFKNFTSHITIGNYTVENVNVKKLEKELRKILKNVLEKDIVIDNIEGVFCTDSDTTQDKMELIWRKMFSLKK